MTFVITTGVLVRGILHTGGYYMRVIGYGLDEQFSIALDDRIYFEYVAVLNTERFAFKKNDIDYLLKFIKETANFITPQKLNAGSADPVYLKFAEAAKSAKADALVVHNASRFEFAKRFTPVLSPQGSFRETSVGRSLFFYITPDFFRENIEIFNMVFKYSIYDRIIDIIVRVDN